MKHPTEIDYPFNTIKNLQDDIAILNRYSQILTDLQKRVDKRIKAVDFQLERLNILWEDAKMFTPKN